MTKRLVRVAHCYRCIYTWRMRRQFPRMCPRCKSRLWNVPKIRPVVMGHGLGIEEIVRPHRGEIARLAKQYGIRRFRIFGSVRRREATPDSDVDLLVDWPKPHSILDRVSLATDLEEVLGRTVDIVNEHGLHWAIQPQVDAEAVPL